MKPCVMPLNRAESSKISNLTVLPVFFRLQGKSVLMAGNSEALAWKVELIAATDANVFVYLGEVAPHEELKKLAHMHNVTLIEKHWKFADWQNIAIAIADCNNDAKEFYQQAQQAGVMVNIIDQPAYCQFQFGSIVNRSPVVIGISTTGAAPVLGQSIRQKIETLLPHSISFFAKKAQSIRDEVMQKLPLSSQRKAFWSTFTEKSFFINPDILDSAELIKKIKNTDTGKVTLVGAGPGEAELLTIKAVRALQSADVILFDNLISNEVLELARREAKRIFVGKRAGRDSCKQDDINDLMVALAKKGKRVVRLKSGDPMIFGRAGEEIAILQQNNIPFDVVPGISAGLALAAKIGCSLTHRHYAQSVQFVTGHSKNGGLPENLDWHGLSNSKTTNIYYMASNTIEALVEKLIQHGLVKTTPAVVAASLTRDDEKLWHGQVVSLPKIIEEFDNNAPIIIAIGDALSPINNQKAKKVGFLPS